MGGASAPELPSQLLGLYLNIAGEGLRAPAPHGFTTRFPTA